MAYICPDCGKSARLPDFCCGRSMVRKGSYFCKSCGNSQATSGTCCNEPMVQI